MNNSLDKTLDLREIFSVLIKRKWLFILPVIIATLSAYAGSFLIEKEYSASTIIWIDKPGSVSRELISIIGGNTFRRESSSDRLRKLDALQNELKSQTYLVQLIENLNLGDNPAIIAKAEKMKIAYPSFSLLKLKTDLLLEDLRKKISVIFVGADQIKLTVKSNKAVLAKDLVTELTAIMEKEKTKYELEKILDNQNFADLQLEKTEIHYKQVIDSLTLAQTKLSKVTLSSVISSEQNRHGIQSELNKLAREIRDTKRSKENAASRLSDSGIKSPRLRSNSNLKQVKSQFATLITDRSEMVEKYQWTGQKVVTNNIRIADRLGDAEKIVGTIVENEFSNFNSDQIALVKNYLWQDEKLKLLEKRKDMVKESFTSMEERINLVPRLTAQISELKNRVEDARKYRDAFKSEETTVQILTEQARERTKYKVIEPARVPLEPVSPDRTKISILGLILGLVIGGTFVLLKELFDASFKRVEDVEDVLGIPVLAVIPKIEKLKVG